VKAKDPKRHEAAFRLSAASRQTPPNAHYCSSRCSSCPLFAWLSTERLPPFIEHCQLRHADIICRILLLISILPSNTADNRVHHRPSSPSRATKREAERRRERGRHAEPRPGAPHGRLGAITLLGYSPSYATLSAKIAATSRWASQGASHCQAAVCGRERSSSAGNRRKR